MMHSYLFKCDSCGDEQELSTIYDDDGGRCQECETGHYWKCGESYDQDYINEMKYREQQDQEYEERHRYDDDERYRY